MTDKKPKDSTREMPDVIYAFVDDYKQEWMEAGAVYPSITYATYTHTARLLELVRGMMVDKDKLASMTLEQAKIRHAALQDVEKLLTQKD